MRMKQKIPKRIIQVWGSLSPSAAGADKSAGLPLFGKASATNLRLLHPDYEYLLFDDAAIWQTLRTAITGIENRVAVPLKLQRTDGSVLACTTMPLPDGATMLTFQDITDAENVERALRERNEALEAADRIKIGFVNHVSYQLRSPLTSIIGFVRQAAIGDPLMSYEDRVKAAMA